MLYLFDVRNKIVDFLVISGESILVFILDMCEYLFDLEPCVTLRVGTRDLPAAAPLLMIHHGRLGVQHLAPVVVILAVHLKLVVPDHLLNLHVPVRWIGVLTVSLRTSFSEHFLVANHGQRFQLIVTMFTYFMTVFTREEL